MLDKDQSRQLPIMILVTNITVISRLSISLNVCNELSQDSLIIIMRQVGYTELRSVIIVYMHICNYICHNISIYENSRPYTHKTIQYSTLQTLHI